jgi:hypothetical protein
MVSVLGMGNTPIDVSLSPVLVGGAFPLPGACPTAWNPYTQLGEAGQRPRVFNRAMEKVQTFGVEPELLNSRATDAATICGVLSHILASRLGRGFGAANDDAFDASPVASLWNGSRSHPSPCHRRPQEDEVRRA